MARGKKHTAEQIIGKLREAELLISQGQSTEAAAKVIGVTVQTFFRWRKEYGGLRVRPGKAAEGFGERERTAEAVAGGCLAR